MKGFSERTRRIQVRKMLPLKQFRNSSSFFPDSISMRIQFNFKIYATIAIFEAQHHNSHTHKVNDTVNFFKNKSKNHKKNLAR